MRWLALIWSTTALGDTVLEGWVVGVTDGDTLTVLDATKRQHKIRLAEIDAPELAQAHGQGAKRGLSKLCYRKDATIRVTDQDRYGRLVGQVICQGIDANAEMVRQGYAWVYEKYARPSSPLYALQGDAKRRRLGLWDDVDARPPWE